MNRILLYILIFMNSVATAEVVNGDINGNISCKGQPLALADIILEKSGFKTQSDSKGDFTISNVPQGRYYLLAEAVACKARRYQVTVRAGKVTQLNLQLDSNVFELSEMIIITETKNSIGKLRNVEGTSIFAGKKTEVIQMERVVANTAINNSRQIYAKVAGLNIWESDPAGLQLGIGGRGLNPNRVSNFNTRQNGYDISADALGYPESYYTPPADAVSRIEIVRGASSLQYGSQFGGIVNFRMNQPDPKSFVSQTKITAGSYGFYSFFNSLSGTKKKWSYYTFYQHKRGDGWRPNSHFESHNAYASLIYRASDKLKFTVDYTFMNYLAQQAGGLTDAMFKSDPSQSVRSRNFFKVNWNLGALLIDYKFSEKISFNTRFFTLVAGRDALGVLNFINRADPMKERDLWKDRFFNLGNENRFLIKYKIASKNSILVAGSRTYKGNTFRKQGMGNSGYTGYKNDFKYMNPGDLEHSQFHFPGFNQAFFAENILYINEKFSLIPGIRYEIIQTKADGFYNQVNYDLAGNVIYKKRIEEKQLSKRSILLAGIGMSLKPKDCMEFYSNISRNYRSINFNDIRVNNPNLVVDPNISDEKGFTVDAGFRGSCKHWFNYDVSVFYIRYNNRIGSILVSDSSSFNTYRFRTNISDSRNIGIESYSEIDFIKLLIGKHSHNSFALFTNVSFIDARYINSKQTSFANRKVEFVPSIIARTGLTYRYFKSLSISLQYSYTGEQFTDATNSLYTANAVNGLIPSYGVFDLTINYHFKQWQISGSINNLTNSIYFTRRAEGYPGPGIIPAEPRSIFLTIGYKFEKK